MASDRPKGVTDEIVDAVEAAAIGGYVKGGHEEARQHIRAALEVAWPQPLLTSEEAKAVLAATQQSVDVMRTLTREHQRKYGLPLLESARAKIEVGNA
jgi:hypothetical protein